MFSRTPRPATISLPLYNSPHSHSPRVHSLRRNFITRYMALGLLIFLVFVTIFAFGRATPLIRDKAQLELTLKNAALFQSNIEAMTEIYRGGENVRREHINHLIIVTGHAILLDKSNYMNDGAWVLESFQKGGQVATFIDHIRKGIEIAKDDDRALLVFSGYDLLLVLELICVEDKHVRWLDREVKDNRIGIWQTTFIEMINQWRSFFLNASYQKNLHEIHMRMFSFLYVDFMK
jgi:hypothetical protein